MNHNESISLVAQVIQLAVAPVFLLAGIGALLSMLSIRLGRVVDRARLLESQIPKMESSEAAHMQTQARTCWRRIRLIYWAIRLAVCSALLICLVVICLFIGDWIDAGLGVVIASLFVGAMTLISAALLCLLIEVSISTRRMRQSLEHHLT
ncbi:DUF2721 domain-containing protein [Elongatibacter sediminis]|uniref:DUF2721 domain-containing protein n=1 Tax=Elongatibacter sediminis TaxID=3119006 RepID=A0AAW9RJS1_9GAMM